MRNLGSSGLLWNKHASWNIGIILVGLVKPTPGWLSRGSRDEGRNNQALWPSVTLTLSLALSHSPQVLSPRCVSDRPGEWSVGTRR
ncbi:hypothetical protein RRG08_065617 [Elysia crispata]|uniref:Uncharacterized protein n=1 Tax=Elysia crispata TaxID=231223 RepID=A0AAE0YNC1_9GAST|nr:hypothetical protein RRG08_065617 [Elysia crispata]